MWLEVTSARFVARPTHPPNRCLSRALRCQRLPHSRPIRPFLRPMHRSMLRLLVLPSSKIEHTAQGDHRSTGDSFYRSRTYARWTLLGGAKGERKGPFCDFTGTDRRAAVGQCSIEPEWSATPARSIFLSRLEPQFRRRIAITLLQRRQACWWLRPLRARAAITNQ